MSLPFNPWKYALWAGLLPICLLSCGIPTLDYLAPPITFPITEPGRLLFQHNHTDNNIDSFIGYNIYYKFYDNTDNGVKCSTDKTFITSDPIVLNDSRLIARNFRRIILDGYDQINPIVTIGAKGTPVEIEIQLADHTASAAERERSLLIQDAVLPDHRIYRNVLNNDGSSVFKPLYGVKLDSNTIYEQNDIDIINNNSANDKIDNIVAADGPLATETLYIAFYAIGYGIDLGNFNVIYSEPIFLGYLSMFLQSSAESICNT